MGEIAAVFIVRAKPSNFTLATLSEPSQATFSKVIEETREIGFDKCRKHMEELGARIREGRVGILSFFLSLLRAEASCVS